MANANITIDPSAVLQTRISLPQQFAMIEFLRRHTGEFISDVGQGVGESVNAANAAAVATELRAQGCTKLDERDFADDDNGHPTTTSIWKQSA